MSSQGGAFDPSSREHNGRDSIHVVPYETNLTPSDL
jgi:hypothetical protein